MQTIMATIADVLMPAPPMTSTAPFLSDPQAEVQRLFSAHGGPLYRFCVSMLGAGGEAEDVVQDAFLKLLVHLQAAGDRSNLRAWLFTVAANGCRDRLRRRARWLPWLPDHDLRTVEPAPDDPDLRPLRQALRALAPRDRLLLSLRAQGLSYADIASAAGIRSTSVGRMLVRALDRWKRRIASAPARARG